MQLIDEARHAWRFASVRLAIVAGAVAQWSATDPQGYADFMQSLPLWARMLVGIAVTSAAIGSRVVKKGGKSDGQ